MHQRIRGYIIYKVVRKEDEIEQNNYSSRNLYETYITYC